MLAIAHTNSQRLVQLVNDILDIEKMEAGRVVFNFRRAEVRQWSSRRSTPIRDMPKTMACEFGSRTRVCCYDVRADPDRLLQVVTNLLSNAIKFSPPDSEVVVAIEKGTDIVRITVRDHGPGIPIDFKPLIFEKFAQADAGNNRKKGGTGLGLSIVKQIVDRLGGEVGFADAPGGGTIFHVQLPCWDHVASLAIDRDAKPEAVRLLLCEDDSKRRSLCASS